MKPPSPWTGSRITAATVAGSTWARKSCSSAGDRVVGGDPAVRVRRGRAVDLRRERPEALLVGLDLAGQRHRHQRAAVEAAVEGDDRRAAGGGAGDLHRVLDGLGAGVQEDRLLVFAAAGRELAEPAADLHVGLVGGDHEALVQVLVDLRVDRVDHGLRVVAEVLAADAAGEVQVADAVGAVDVGALGGVATIAGAATPRATQRSRAASVVSGWICDAVMAGVSPSHARRRPPVLRTKPAPRGLDFPRFRLPAVGSGVCSHAMRSAVELAAALRRRELSAVEALEDALARADAVPARRSPCGSTSAPAPRPSPPTPRWPAARAARCAACRSRVKDSHWIAGVPTTFGSSAVEPLIPVETVGAVRRLEDAGAVIFAKTATPEFCYAGTTPGLGQPARSARARRAARPAAPRPRWRPARARSRWAATAAARSASRPRSAGSSASSRRSARCRASRPPRAGRRWSPTGRWPARSPTRG